MQILSFEDLSLELTDLDPMYRSGTEKTLRFRRSRGFQRSMIRPMESVTKWF